MNVQPIQAIEEVNMFKADGNVIHFSAPKGRFQSTSKLSCKGDWPAASCKLHNKTMKTN